MAFTLSLGAVYFLARNTPVGPSLYNLASISACVAFVVGPILHGCRAIQWWLFAGAMGLFAIADALWEVYVLTVGEAPYPSAADAFYLAAYPLFVLGVLVLLRGSRPRKPASAAARGNAVRAARLAGAAEVVNERVGYSLQPAERRLRERAEAEARQALGDDRFEELFAEGRALEGESALVEAAHPPVRPD